MYVVTHAWGCALLAHAVMSTIHRTCGFQVANSFPEVTCSLAAVQKLSSPTGLMEMYRMFARKLIQIICYVALSCINVLALCLHVIKTYIKSKF